MGLYHSSSLGLGLSCSDNECDTLLLGTDDRIRYRGVTIYFSSFWSALRPYDNQMYQLSEYSK
ncbi:hypothetical protein V6Z11_A03G187200 [Gossypium hirsutum]